MNLNFAGKVVVITGATANIGRGIALEFATEGAQVIAVGRDESAGQRWYRKHFRAVPSRRSL